MGIMVKNTGYPLVLPLSSSSGKAGSAAYDEFGLKYCRLPSSSFPFRKPLSILLALFIVLLFGYHFQLVPRLTLESNSRIGILSSRSQRFWGPYSPYYSIEEYQPPPNGCSITQASTLAIDLVLNTHCSHRSRSTFFSAMEHVIRPAAPLRKSKQVCRNC
jgi:hypothetical protein